MKKFIPYLSLLPVLLITCQETLYAAEANPAAGAGVSTDQTTDKDTDVLTILKHVSSLRSSDCHEASGDIIELLTGTSSYDCRWLTFKGTKCVYDNSIITSTEFYGTFNALTPKKYEVHFDDCSDDCYSDSDEEAASKKKPEVAKDTSYDKEIAQTLLTPSAEHQLFYINVSYGIEHLHSFVIEKHGGNWRIFHAHAAFKFSLAQWLGFDPWPHDSTQEITQVFNKFGSGKWFALDALLDFFSQDIFSKNGHDVDKEKLFYHIKKLTLDPERLKKLAAASCSNIASKGPDAKEGAAAGAGAGS